MLAIRRSELGSTGAAEMSWFQGLSSGNGRRPPRLACTPSLTGLLPVGAAVDGGVSVEESTNGILAPATTVTAAKVSEYTLTLAQNKPSSTCCATRATRPPSAKP